MIGILAMAALATAQPDCAKLESMWRAATKALAKDSDNRQANAQAAILLELMVRNGCPLPPVEEKKS